MSKYQKIYDAIIVKARAEGRIGYTETHHIIPKSLNGSNHPDNLVKLSAREHFICHYLLCKIYPKNSIEYHKMIFALRMMKNINGQHQRYFNSRLYEIVRKNISESARILNQGKVLSENHKEAIRKKLTGVKKSPEAIKKRSKARLGKKRSPESIEKQIKTQTGKPRTAGYFESMEKFINSDEAFDIYSKASLRGWETKRRKAKEKL
jgi:hypothetical protein